MPVLSDTREKVRERLAGLLLGTAAGDSLGLPGEGLSRRQWARRFPGPLRRRLFFGRGMVSDDTEHTVMVAQALLASGGDPGRFLRSFSRRLRWWLLALPAGAGRGTLRAAARLWLGVPPERSGVCSAGNGAAMRVALLGALSAGPEELEKFVAAATRITHRDPRALSGARAVAEAVVFAREFPRDASPETAVLAARLRSCGDDPEWRELVGRMEEDWRENRDVAAFAAGIGQGRRVTGYVYHTVPVAIYSWWRHRGDFRAALTEAIRCGGDADTVGAITGAVAGFDVGVSGIPDEYLSRLTDYPLSRNFLLRLADRLTDFAAGVPAVPLRPAYWIVPFRNLGFLTVVLSHGLYRLARLGF